MGLDGFRLKHFRILVALVEHRKISIVADLFGVSQPAMSRTIVELEQMAGYKLFQRHSRGMVPTEQGEIIVRHARVAVEDARRVEYEMATAALGRGGHVAFGTVMTPASDYVAPVLKKVFEIDPTLNVHIAVDSSDALLKILVQRRLDFAICRIPVGNEAKVFSYFALGNETLRLVVAPNHPLAVKPYVQEADFAEQDWVLQEKGSVLRSVVDEFHRRNGLHPKSVVSTASVLLTILLVVQTHRIGIFADTFARLLDQHGLIKALPLSANLTVPDFGIITLKDRELSAPAQFVLNTFIQQRAKESGVPNEPERDDRHW